MGVTRCWNCKFYEMEDDIVGTCDIYGNSIVFDDDYCDYAAKIMDGFPFWKSDEGCCSCKYGIHRGSASRQTHGEKWFLFECNREEKLKFTRPDDKCEHYVYSKKSIRNNIRSAVMQRDEYDEGRT